MALTKTRPVHGNIPFFHFFYGAEFYTPPPPTPENTLLGVGGEKKNGGGEQKIPATWGLKIYTPTPLHWKIPFGQRNGGRGGGRLYNFSLDFSAFLRFFGFLRVFVCFVFLCFFFFFRFFVRFSLSLLEEKGKLLQCTAKTANFTPTPSPNPCKTSRQLHPQATA